MKMFNYLSFGGGVNSVALYLYLIEANIEFEAVFVNHGTDWPETYEYLELFQDWLQRRGHRKITIIKPSINDKKFKKIQWCLYDYCLDHSMVPSIFPRWCTRMFKLEPIFKYYKKPCFSMIGIDAGEAKRAKVQHEAGIENRYPLIEAGIDRADCLEIIEKNNLPTPIKSGCYICPYQKAFQWKELRRKHSDLFCAAEELENRNIEYRLSKNKAPMYLAPTKKPLKEVVQESQMNLFNELDFPPCYCGL